MVVLFVGHFKIFLKSQKKPTWWLIIDIWVCIRRLREFHSPLSLVATFVQFAEMRRRKFHQILGSFTQDRYGEILQQVRQPRRYLDAHDERFVDAGRMSKTEENLQEMHWQFPEILLHQVLYP